jgi:hypothetical protein
MPDDAIAVLPPHLAMARAERLHPRPTRPEAPVTTPAPEDPQAAHLPRCSQCGRLVEQASFSTDDGKTFDLAVTCHGQTATWSVPAALAHHGAADAMERIAFDVFMNRRMAARIRAAGA